MLSVSDKRDFLKNVLTFKSLSAEQINQLAQICEYLSYKTGDEIFKQGETGGALYLLISGQVLVQREIVNDTSTVSLNIVRPPQYFGEMTLSGTTEKTMTMKLTTVNEKIKPAERISKGWKKRRRMAAKAMEVGMSGLRRKRGARK